MPKRTWHAVYRMSSRTLLHVWCPNGKTPFDFSPEVRGLALDYTEQDRIIYGEAQDRFFDVQLASVANSTMYVRALHDLNTLPHVCKNDDSGIGSGRCW